MYPLGNSLVWGYTFDPMMSVIRRKSQLLGIADTILNDIFGEVNQELNNNPE